MTISINHLLIILDLIGVFAFAISGASAGVERRLDLFGVLVLSFVAATFGGLLRDVLIGDIPPAALTNLAYLWAALGAGLAVFFWSSWVAKLKNPVLFFDAVGLSFFMVAGTQKALSFGITPVMAAILGVLTGIGGGVMRDVLLAQIPTVLRAEVYALAALAGAAVIVGGDALNLPPAPCALAGAAVCLILRLLAIRRGWKLPSARTKSDPEHPTNRIEN